MVAEVDSGAASFMATQFCVYTNISDEITQIQDIQIIGFRVLWKFDFNTRWLDIVG